MNTIKRILICVCFLTAFLLLCCDESGNNNDNSDDDNNTDDTVTKWSLWAEGTKLRGINIWQRKVYKELDGNEFLGSAYCGPPYTQDDFDRLAAMGANYVNISHPGLYTEKPPYQLDVQVEANLDALLEMIEKADMFAVISFRTGPGRSEFTFYYGDDWFSKSYLNENVWKLQAAQDAWKEMWKYTAQKYKDNAIIVGYDLMVEPNSEEAIYNLWDPEIFYNRYKNTLADWNQLHPKIASTIREVDLDTPILIGGQGYSSIEWLPYLIPNAQEKVVYTAHQYEPFVYTHQDYSKNMKSYPGTWDADWDGRADTVNNTWMGEFLGAISDFSDSHSSIPMAVNEFGVHRFVPGAAQFMDDQINKFEEFGINYAHWMWSSSWLPYASEIDEFDMMHGTDPNNHTNVTTSALIEVIKKYWAKNTDKPSNTRFK
ncbi:MAG: cellulase family glycosylhydrolase [Acidobacteria bacterium]|nr:cellulase family glycosylhydrolase [Acidobacteriota bacterium]